MGEQNNDQAMVKYLHEFASTLPNHVNARVILRKIADRLVELSPLEPPPPPDSIPVRIAAAVNARGNAVVKEIESPFTDDERLEHARRGVIGRVAAEAIITAHIPRRHIPQVTGVVEEVMP